MISEAQYTAATALFSAMQPRDAGARSRDELFALYQECLDAVTGKRAPRTTYRTFQMTCPQCGQTSELAVPVD